jgi:hypothetical protein
MTDAGLKRKRDKYSRLICLGCRDRRIRCELPSYVDTPLPGELRTIHTPCRRCKKIGMACIVRQTVLGRPSPRGDATTAASSASSPALSESSTHSVQSQGALVRQHGNDLSLHKPHSTHSVLIIHALETLRNEHVEEEWFRHLPAHYGHTPALDLSIQALVTACAYSRGVPKVTVDHCYRALSIAVNAVQETIKQSSGDSNDHILASTALLVPFEGVIRQTGMQTKLHVDGLAAMLAARRPAYPITQLARDIVDFHICETGVMACVQDRPSPFEHIPREYLISNETDGAGRAEVRIKALTNELFARLPRLVMLVRGLRQETALHQGLLREVLQLIGPLLELQDVEAEAWLLENSHTQPSTDVPSPLTQRLEFPSIRNYEALANYWQGRLMLLRLVWRVQEYNSVNGEQVGRLDGRGAAHWSSEMSRLADSLLMCAQYAGTLLLFKQHRLLAHAMVVVWGATLDVSVGCDYSHDGMISDTMAAFILQHVNIALPAKPAFTAKDVDVAADVSAGGRPRGRVAQFYGM